MACKPDFKLIRNFVYDDGDSYQDGYLIVDQHFDGEDNCNYYAQVYSRKVGLIVMKALQRTTKCS